MCRILEILKNLRHLIIFREIPEKIKKSVNMMDAKNDEFDSKQCKLLQNFQKNQKMFRKSSKILTRFSLKIWDRSGAKACKSCRSRQELSNEYLLFTCKHRLRYSRKQASQKLRGDSIHSFNSLLRLRLPNVAKLIQMVRQSRQLCSRVPCSPCSQFCRWPRQDDWRTARAADLPQSRDQPEGPT